MEDRGPISPPEEIIKVDAQLSLSEAAPGTVEKPTKKQSATSESKTATNGKDPRSDLGSKEAVCWVRNQTPKRLRIEFGASEPAEQTLVLAPLAEQELIVKSAQEEKGFKELASQGLIAYKKLTKAEKLNLEGLGSIIFSLAFTYFIFSGILTSEYPGLKIVLWGIVPAVAAVSGVVAALVFGLGLTTVLRVFQQGFTLFLVLATGGGLSAGVIYYFGGGQQLLSEEPALSLLGRLLQFTFIAVASLLPALLYFLFDRHRLGTLRTHFEQQIFRFDPTVKTLADVHAKYGSQLDELYGRDPTTAKGRHIPGTRWPIWVCTLVITMGWIVTLPPAEVGLEASTSPSISAFLYPDHSAIAFGFLGAYYFAIFSVSRRYTRGDLQPKAYSHIVVRIFIVFIMAWVIETVVGAHDSMFALIFLIGVMPETFWTVFNEFVRNQLLGPVIHSLKERDPLTNLEGIDPYDRARLAEEGVTNIESLAHHDLIDLILTTRIPVPRLVDWLDQAILYLHLPNDWYPFPLNVKHESNEVEDTSTLSGGENVTTPLTMRQRLKTYGIRTATDFLRAYHAAEGRNNLKSLFCILDEREDHIEEEKASRIQVLYDTLLDDEWLSYIRHWRRSIEIEEATIRVDVGGRTGVY